MLTAKIDNGAASGNVTVVAAQTGKIIRVHGYVITGQGAVVCKFQSGAGGTDLTGPLKCTDGGGVAAMMPPSDVEPEASLFETAAGALLNLNSGAAVQVGGHISYSIVPST